jgi:hypothetical protein
VRTVDRSRVSEGIGRGVKQSSELYGDIDGGLDRLLLGSFGVGVRIGVFVWKLFMLERRVDSNCDIVVYKGYVSADVGARVLTCRLAKQLLWTKGILLRFSLLNWL